MILFLLGLFPSFELFPGFLSLLSVNIIYKKLAPIRMDATKIIEDINKFCLAHFYKALFLFTTLFKSIEFNSHSSAVGILVLGDDIFKNEKSKLCTLI